MSEATINYLINYGILGLIALGVGYVMVWGFRQFAPRLLSVMDAQMAMTNSVQTSTLNITGALERIDRSLEKLTDYIEEREEEDMAFRQSAMERLNSMEHTMSMLVIAHQQKEGVNCGSSECPAMQLLSRPASTRTRKSDHAPARTREHASERQHERYANSERQHDHDHVMGDSG
jgi:hypothetical protein